MCALGMSSPMHALNVVPLHLASCVLTSHSAECLSTASTTNIPGLKWTLTNLSRRVGLTLYATYVIQGLAGASCAWYIPVSQDDVPQGGVEPFQVHFFVLQFLVHWMAFPPFALQGSMYQQLLTPHLLPHHWNWHYSDSIIQQRRGLYLVMSISKGDVRVRKLFQQFFS